MGGSRKENKLVFFWTSPVFLQLVCQGQMVKERASHHHFDTSESRLVSSPPLWESLFTPSAGLRLLLAALHGSQLCHDTKIPKFQKLPLELVILRNSAYSETLGRVLPAAILQAGQLYGYRQAKLCELYWESKGKEI